MALMGLVLIVTGIARLATGRSIAVFLSTAVFGLLSLIVAARVFIASTGPPPMQTSPEPPVVPLAIAIGLAVIGVNAVWLAATDPVNLALRVIGFFGGGCMLFGSFGVFTALVLERVRSDKSGPD